MPRVHGSGYPFDRDGCGRSQALDPPYFRGHFSRAEVLAALVREALARLHEGAGD